MTTPTLAELAGALDIVRRHHLAVPVMPTLDQLAETVAEHAEREQLGEALHAAIEKSFGRCVYSPRDLARVVRAAIESTGARITSDVVGYGIARSDTDLNGGWELESATTYDVDDLASAESAARHSSVTRPVALHLLPKGSRR